MKEIRHMRKVNDQNTQAQVSPQGPPQKPMVGKVGIPKPAPKEPKPDSSGADIPDWAMDPANSTSLTAEEKAEIEQAAKVKITPEVINRGVLEEKINQEIATAKGESAELKEEQSPSGILKILIAKGSYREDVKIFNHIWTIKALNQKEVILAFNEVKDENTTITGKTSALVFGQLAYAIEAVDGVSIYEWFPEVKLSDFPSVEAFQYSVRRVFLRYLEEMPNSIINEFVENYNEIEFKRNSAVGELKNL